jgi:eukaryotic-like serine/threonine-protein kinase
MPRFCCPPPAELERLFLGGGPEQEVDALEQHLLECDSCLETAKTLSRDRDPLPGLLRGQKLGDPFGDSPMVDDLMRKLQSLRTSSASRRQGTAMLALSCSACHKKLSVAENLAGKKIKCPACGQATAVPALASVPFGSEKETMPRAEPAGQEQVTMLPTVDGAGSPPTSSSLSKSHSTEGGEPAHKGHDSSLTNFLAPPQADDELGRLGKYRILKILGHGGMGVVYKAEDPLLKRTVAVKAMLPWLAANANAGQRFRREAQAMAGVEHDHIVRIYQVDEERGVPFLAMEFLKGEPLDERLQREQTLPLSEVLRMGREIAEGLAAAHATGLIHRDIKPGNIWLEAPRSRVKILDFGLARATGEEACLTQQGAIVGTPAYMAPEQGRGEVVDVRCDLFSLGVVLYRLCCGTQPFKGRDTVSTLMSVAMDQPTPPSQINTALPVQLSELVMRLLEKDPARRPSSAAAVVETLQGLEKTLAQPTVSREAPASQRPARLRAAAPHRRRLRLLIGVGLLAALVGLGLWAAGLIRFHTDQGDFVVETDDPDFAFSVSKGQVTLEDRKTKRIYNVKVLHHDKDSYELEVTDADLSFTTKTLTIRRGQQVALKAWGERKQGASDKAWLKEVAALPAEKQVEAVVARLKELNPDFDGKETHIIDGVVVTELYFPTDNVTDISPLRALTGLTGLNCSGTHTGWWNNPGKGQLADLSPLKDLKLKVLWCESTKVSSLLPLKDMKLQFLSCRATQVSDLSPLKDMKLTQLWCDGTQVTDLSPLKDMKLTRLLCNATKVSDLSPLKDMRLIDLGIDETQVFDLSPLKDMKLTGLGCGRTAVSDLSALKDMKLTSLSCDATQVSDLSPLKDMKMMRLTCNQTQVSDLSPVKDMKLTFLWCGGTQVTDLSLLKGMPLKELVCDFNAERDAEILRSIKTLEKINEKPVQEFWKEVDVNKQDKKP